MADINVDVNLPSTISVDVTSPTQALATNISIPGAQGPRGEKGNPTSINSLTAENIVITGVNGNIVYNSGLNTIFVSGNSGYFQSAVNSLTTNLNNTGANLNTSINNLSGYVNSQDTNLSNNLVSTGSSLQSNINTLSSNLNSTGSNLNNKITSLSGTLTGNYYLKSNPSGFITGVDLSAYATSSAISSTYATILNLQNTGSNLQTQINNLDNVYATDVDITNLNNKITSLSGDAVLKYGNQTIQGKKTFTEDLIVQKSGFFWSGIKIGLNSITITEESIKISGDPVVVRSTFTGYTGDVVNTYATITSLASTGSTLISSINSLNSAFTGFTGNLDATYATDSQLTSTGTTLISTINSLSGTLTGNYLTTNSASSTYATIINLASTGSTLTTNLASTGSTLQTNINNLSNTYATITNLASTGSTLVSSINSLSGTLTGNYVTNSNGQFTNRPTVNGTGVLLSGETSAITLPTAIVYMTGDQTISGFKTFNTGILFILPPTGTGIFGIGPYINITGSLASGNLFTGISITLGADNSTNAGTNRLISARVGGTDRFFVRSDGQTTIGGATTIQGSISTNNNIVMTATTPTISMYVGGAGNLTLSSDNISGNLSIRNGVNPTQLRVFNITGTNTGEFGLFGWRNNELIIGPQQTNSGTLRNLTLTGANININASGSFNIFDNTNIVGDLNVTGNILLSGKSVLTGIDLSTLNTTINNLSGYINSSSSNIVFTTGNQTISGVKTFTNTGVFTSGIDLNNSNLINATPQIINLSSNFNISGDYNSRMIMVNSANEVTGRIVSGNALGFNTTITQVGAGKIFITGSGIGINIGSYNNQYRTAGQFATASLLHTGNNGYMMYGNTAS